MSRIGPQCPTLKTHKMILRQRCILDLSTSRIDPQCPILKSECFNLTVRQRCILDLSMSRIDSEF